MADQKKKGGSKVLTLVGLLAVLVLAGGISGYMYPNLLWSPLVQKFFQKGAEGMDKSGVYKVAIKSVTLSPEEFDQGENLDIQVTVDRIDAQGKSTKVWDSREFGARKAKVGKDPLTAAWADRPFELEWRTGEKLVVKVWDRAPLIGSTELCAWETDGNEVFQLKGTHSFDKVKDKTPRPGGTNQIVLEATRQGDLPAQQ
ncbi:MAG: hypothetical protein IPP14_05050 [Planctomycetes bacterium]|nr:hypothetical protein [Planctomycetota bacterium]